MHCIFYTLTLFGWLACSGQGCMSPTAPLVPEITNVPVPLGDSAINIQVSNYSLDSTIIFIHLHDNEATAKRAMHQTLQKRGGIFISVENNQNRLLEFTDNKKVYTFDPNRVFTSAGLKANLKLFNAYTPFSVKEVKRFSSNLLALIPQNAMVIAVHNNTNEEYSICSYLENKTYKSDAKKVHVEPAKDPDDFFITTNETLYNALSTQHFNAVLLNNKTSTDDGSLSKYFGKSNRPYVNIEAQHDHLEEQTKMIQSLLEILKNEKEQTKP